MGNHLGVLKSLARDAFERELNFRNAESDPEELILLKYHPLDSEGQFSDERVKIFDWTTSGFLFQEAYKESDFEKAKANYRKTFLPKECFGSFQENATLAERAITQRQIFRPLPINWSSFELLPIIPSLIICGEFTNLVSETNDFKYRKTTLEVLNYLANIRQQIVVGSLLNKLEFDGLITGCYTNPLRPFTDGILVPLIKPELCDGTSWIKSFDFAEELRVTLPEWFDKMSRDSQNHSDKFFLFLKLSISGFRNRLHLENTNYWVREGLESSLICNLKTYNSLLSLFVGFMKNVNNKLWTRLRKTEKMLGEILETILKG